MNAAQLDFVIAGAALDERIAAYRREQVEQRAREVLWNRYDAELEERARQRVSPFVSGGNATCSTCAQRIEPGQRWVCDPYSGVLLDPRYRDFGIEHAACVVDVRR